MCDEYKKIYNKLIVDQSKGIIIDYKPQNKTYKYYPFSHQASSSSLDDLYNLITDNIIFYAFDQNEIIKLNENIAVLEDLRAAAKYAFANRLPKRTDPNSDGTVGEVLLDLLIQTFEPHSQKLIARAKYTEVGKRKNEITGYDALYFTLDGGQLTLWLGQAKAGAEDYCKSDIKKDLNTKFGSEYFADTAYYIADKVDSDKSLINILNEINKICFKAQKDEWTKDQKIDMLYKLLKDNNVAIKIPCLLAFTNDIYSSGDLENNVSTVVKKVMHYYERLNYSIDLKLPYEIRFYVFPIKDVSYIRKKIVEFKKGVT